MKIVLEDNKYTYLSNDRGQWIHRYTEPWRDVTGDKFIRAAMMRIEELEKLLKEKEGIGITGDRNDPVLSQISIKNPVTTFIDIEVKLASTEAALRIATEHIDLQRGEIERLRKEVSNLNATLEEETEETSLSDDTSAQEIAALKTALENYHTSSMSRNVILETTRKELIQGMLNWQEGFCYLEKLGDTLKSILSII